MNSRGEKRIELHLRLDSNYYFFTYFPAIDMNEIKHCVSVQHDDLIYVYTMKWFPQ